MMNEDVLTSELSEFHPARMHISDFVVLVSRACAHMVRNVGTSVEEMGIKEALSRFAILIQNACL
jgi:hypothetical protein